MKKVRRIKLTLKLNLRKIVHLTTPTTPTLFKGDSASITIFSQYRLSNCSPAMTFAMRGACFDSFSDSHKNAFTLKILRGRSPLRDILVPEACARSLSLKSITTV